MLNMYRETTHEEVYVRCKVFTWLSIFASFSIDVNGQRWRQAWRSNGHV